MIWIINYYNSPWRILVKKLSCFSSVHNLKENLWKDLMLEPWLYALKFMQHSLNASLEAMSGLHNYI